MMVRQMSCCDWLRYPEEHVRMVTHHLQFVLPELLLVGLVEKGKLANMMNEYISQNRQVGI